MRSPVIGLFYCGQSDELIASARDAARVTHAHSLGIEGAVLIALATSAALNVNAPIEIIRQVDTHSESEAFRRRIEVVCKWLEGRECPTAAAVRATLGNGVAAADSCVTALYIAARFLNGTFEEMIRFIAECRGDVDTIGAMAGGIWGAANGVSRLPRKTIDNLEQHGHIVSAANALYESRVS